MHEIAPGLHTSDQDLRFFGVEIGARITVLDTPDGRLVHSPIDIDPATLDGVRWVLAPNKLHHLFVGDWADSGAEVWASPGLPDKRPDVRFHGVVETGTHPFGPDFEVMALTCFNLTNEVVIFHKPGRTLLVTDLVFHFTPRFPWFTRAAMWGSFAYPGCCASLLERVGMNRSVARTEIARILEWDFDRLVMAHGDVIETDGKAALRRAYHWLKL